MLNTLFDMLNMWIFSLTGHYGVKTCLKSQLGCMFVIQNWLINLIHTFGYEISKWLKHENWVEFHADHKSDGSKYVGFLILFGREVWR